MIQRFSSKSNLFTVKEWRNGCQFSWHESLDLRPYKFMAIIHVYTTSWPIDGKKMSHLSSNLTDATSTNPDGHIYTWTKKHEPRLEGNVQFSLKKSQ